MRVFVLALSCVWTANTFGQASTEDLQKQVQNPVASLISLPFQNNTDFNFSPYGRDKNTLNIQPVIPSSLGRVNLVSRVIIPIVAQPYINSPRGTVFGFGDINPTFYFLPPGESKLIWGFGPSMLIPTATHRELQTGRFSIGPSLVVLAQPGRWTIGALGTNMWSVGGPEDRARLNIFSGQYFVNYNLNKGWYLTSAPLISANWRASGGDRWLIPFGGGFGRVFQLGGQALNGNVGYFYNVIHPDNLPYPKWQLRFQLAFLFPR